MTIFSVLKQEHRNVNKIFSELQDMREDSERTPQAWFVLLKQELLSHAEAEHKSLYDRLIDEPATHDVVVSSETEHETVERLLLELEALDMNNPTWMQKLAVLKDHVDDHVHEEENIIFPRAKAILEKNEQEEIAEDYQDRKYYLLETFA